jgi:hypothetical protein
MVNPASVGCEADHKVMGSGRINPFWLENLKERDHSDDLGIDGKIILEILGK